MTMQDIHHVFCDETIVTIFDRSLAMRCKAFLFELSDPLILELEVTRIIPDNPMTINVVVVSKKPKPGEDMHLVSDEKRELFKTMLADCPPAEENEGSDSNGKL